MRPSIALCSKASRLPLNSKKANKDFYKGTGTGNIMQRKRIAVANRFTGEQLTDNEGRSRSWNLKTHRIDDARVPSYIVPPGLAQCELRPLVYLGAEKDNGMNGRPIPRGYPGGGKMKPRVGLDAELYQELRPAILNRRDLVEETRRDLDYVKKAALTKQTS